MPLFHTKITGIVQGVGFRPFVANLARAHRICGTVANKGPYVEIYAQGPASACQSFHRALQPNPPPRATIPTPHPNIMVAQVPEYPYEQALQNETELYRISKSFDEMAIVKKMKEIVPEFKSNNSKYEILDV